MTDSFLSIFVFTAVVLGGIGTILGGISVVLHAIAPRTKTTVDDTLAADVDAGRAKLNELLAFLHGLALPTAPVNTTATNVTITSPQTPSAKAAQAGRARTSVIATLAIGAAALGAVLALAGCSTLRSSASTALTAFIDCEDPVLSKAAADLEPLARAVVSKWIGGSPAVLDTKGLKGDIAGIKDNAQQCAITAAADAIALAATSTPTPNSPAVPLQAHALVTSSSTSNATSSAAGDQVRATFTSLRRELGWAPLHLANGRMM